MKYILLLLFPVQLIAQQTPLLFKDVHVVDVKNGKIVSHQNVLIEGNKIKIVSAKIPDEKGVTVINGTGKYLMPGLCDFNASVMAYENSGSPAFALMIAHGVTSVKDLQPPVKFSEALQLKKSIENGSLLGPRLYLPGQTLVDRKPPASSANSMWYVKTADEASAAVDSLVKWGADVIDARNIKSDTILKAITSAAHMRGRKVMERMTGDWMTASNAGVDAFTHLSDLWRTSSVGREKLFQLFAGDSVVSDQDFYNRILPSLGGLDTAHFFKLMKTLKRNNIWLCTGYASYFQSLRKFEHGDTSRNVFRTARQKLLLANDLKTQSTLTYALVNNEKPDLSQLLMAHRSGVPIIAGTQLNGLQIPGMSMHDILFWLVDGGLTPSEAIRTATRNPAIFLNKQKKLGTVEPGKLADLVLLDADPFQNINNTRKINAVVANGKLFQRADLDKILEEAKQKVRAAR